MRDITYSQMRLMETAQCFAKLRDIYDDSVGNDNVMGTELSEMAGILEETAGCNIRAYTVGKNMDKLIRRALASIGVRADSLMFFRKKNGNVAAALTARTVRHGSVRTALMADTLSEVLGKKLVPLKDGRMVVTETENEFILEQAPRYNTLLGSVSISKEKGSVNGDAYTYVKDCGGKSVMAVADGMGTGREAWNVSKAAVELLEQLVQAGFSEEASFRMINSAFAAKYDEKPVTLDCASIDAVNGKLTLVKQGGAATYVKRGENVDIYRLPSLPAGVLEDADPQSVTVSLEDSQYIIMVSDGVADAIPYIDKEKKLARIIGAVGIGNPQLMAEIIADEITFYLGNEYRDDMTILVMGVWKVLT